MQKMKFVSLVLCAAVLLAGCASKLGYPSKSVGIPTPVTLFSRVAKPSIKNTMGYLARDIWETLYKKKFEDVLAKMSGEREHAQLNASFLMDIAKAQDLFAPGVMAVQEIGVDYTKAQDDKSAFSGYDFGQYKDTIPTPYILALTIDEWGLYAASQNTDNGPFISMTMQLIDKETNATIWKYNYLFKKQVDKDADELSRPDKMDDMITTLIKDGTNAFFMWLGW
jgi:hypothetical protein